MNILRSRSKGPKTKSGLKMFKEKKYFDSRSFIILVVVIVSCDLSSKCVRSSRKYIYGSILERQSKTQKNKSALKLYKYFFSGFNN